MVAYTRAQREFCRKQNLEMHMIVYANMSLGARVPRFLFLEVLFDKNIEATIF